MRTLSVLALLLFLVGDLYAQSNILEGSWEMQSRKLVYPDTVINQGEFPGPSYKILNKTHFAFGRQTIIRDEVMDDVYAGGGRYSVQGDSLYTEHIEYHTSSPLVGQDITFEVRVEGDSLWYHSGQIGNFRLEEVWERVKK